MILECIVPTVLSLSTYKALVQTESAFNPYAIAVVKGSPIGKQAKTRAEAIAKIKALEAENANFSIGLGQINTVNFKRYGVTATDLLNPCTNLNVSQKILHACYHASPNKKVTEALSCYYSGNFRYGFKRERAYRNTSYVERIFNNLKDRTQTRFTREIASLGKYLRRRTIAKKIKDSRFIQQGMIKNLVIKSNQTKEAKKAKTSFNGMIKNLGQ